MAFACSVDVSAGSRRHCIRGWKLSYQPTELYLHAELGEDKNVSSRVEAEIMPGVPPEAQEQRVSNGIQSLLVAACLGDLTLHLPSAHTDEYVQNHRSAEYPHLIIQ